LAGANNSGGDPPPRPRQAKRGGLAGNNITILVGLFFYLRYANSKPTASQGAEKN